MCELYRQDQNQQQAQPGTVIRTNLGIVDGLALRNSSDRGTRWDATQAIRTQTSRLEGELSSANAEIERLNAALRSATSRADGHYEQLQKERHAKRTAQTVARNNKVMALVVRDLTVLFKSVGINVDLDFEQVDQEGYVFRVTGYDSLDLTVNFATYEGSVKNKSRNRKARTFYVDMSGLSADAFVALEALFRQVDLGRSNTPARVHDALFEEDAAGEGPRVTFGLMVGPDCGHDDCSLHGAGGLMEGSDEVPEEVRRVAEAIGAVIGASGVTVLRSKPHGGRTNDGLLRDV